jgi:NitT/TauT family transport system permease protein
MTLRQDSWYARAAAPIFGLAAAAVMLVVLEALIRANLISPYAISPPSEILASFGQLASEEDLLGRVLQTLGEAVAASVLAVVIGVPIGLALYRARLLREACETWIAGMASAPLILLYPLFLVMFGRTVLTIVVMGVLSGLPPIVLKTREGLSATRQVLINVGRNFNLSGAQLFWKIMFPAAVPTIFTGLRLCLLFALINIVGIEFLINFGGLGELIADLADRFDLAEMYGAICFVTLVSVSLFFVTEKVERWLRPA